ncbi:SAM-dependent methyltransferase [Lentzea sp. NPDC005914]|uniref:SAM-dependent methyltransferase n=1 Tax=Lentzea sp. NPDC005914 TaxID=3154572 RepID=UPI0033D1E5D4
MINPKTPASADVPPIWAPGIIGAPTPKIARVRDYWLGGSHHLATDRRLAEQFTLCAPQLPYLVRTHRDFLRRAVTRLVRDGVHQFVDLGSGMPTVGNVHEVAQRLTPECRVVYTDIDPVVVTESRELLAGDDRTAYLHADVCRPEQILDSPELRGLLDLDEPVALLAVDVLHHVPDSAGPAELLTTYVNALGPACQVALSHTCRHEQMLDAIGLYSDIYHEPVPEFAFRSAAEVGDLLTGFEVVEPGLVPIPLWLPDADTEPDQNPEHFSGCAALARRR